MAAYRIYVKSSTVVDQRVGWGAVIHTPAGETWEIAGEVPFERERTAMRSTLNGVVAALGTLPQRATVEVFTDVQYIADGFNHSLDKWILKGWRGKKKKRIAHPDLWEQIVRERNRHKLNIAFARLFHDAGMSAASLAVLGREGERVFVRHPAVPSASGAQRNRSVFGSSAEFSVPEEDTYALDTEIEKLLTSGSNAPDTGEGDT